MGLLQKLGSHASTSSSSRHSTASTLIIDDRQPSYVEAKKESAAVVVAEISPSSIDVESIGTGNTIWKPQKQEYLVMGTVAVISLMVALDATILVPVLPTLAKDLHGTTNEAFWAGTSYLLTCAVFQPFISALSDLFGRQELLLISIAFFTAGSIMCGISHGFTVLLAGRCLQGIGGGGIITSAQVIFADIVPLRQRPKYFTIVLLSWAVGTVLGPLIGGVLVQHSTWRWVFYINLPFCVFGFIFVPLFVKLRSNDQSSVIKKLARVDWVGGFLFIGSLTSFLIGLSFGGTQYPWASYFTLFPLIAGFVGILTSLAWERYVAKDPFLRHSLFKSTSAIAAYTCAFLQGFLLFCGLYYIPFYMMSVGLKTPTGAGINLLPISCFMLPASAIVSALITRLGSFRWALWLGWTITFIGAKCLGFLKGHLDPTIWVPAFIVFGIGNGIALTSVNFAVQAIAETEDCGRAASMYAFMRTLGMTIGVAIGGTVFQNRMTAKLVALDLPTWIAKDAEGYIQVLAELVTSQPERAESILGAYLQGFQAIWWLMTGVSIFALLVSVCIKRHRMDDILTSNFTLDR